MGRWEVFIICIIVIDLCFGFPLDDHSEDLWGNP